MSIKQILSILGSILSALIGAGALFTQLFGQTTTLNIIAVLSIVNLIMQSVTAQLSNQQNTVKEVAAMPGVQSITVNSQASQPLAQVAVSATADAAKIAPTPEAAPAVSAIAKGTTS